MTQNPKPNPTFLREDWSNGACLGYAIKALEIVGLTDEQTKDIIQTMKVYFEDLTVEQARNIYENSRY